MSKPMIYPQFIGRLGNNLFQIAACIGYAKKHNVLWGIKKGYWETSFQVNQVDRFFPHLPACDEQYRGYQEPSFDYKEIPFNPNGCRIVGFWQSEKYFKHAEEEVRKALNIQYVEGYTDRVAVHIRRGDYVKHSGSFPPVTAAYILEALKALKDRGVDTSKLVVFSDDIQWCKDNLQATEGMTIELSEGRNEYEDLCLMASCGHNIIANSSFSWWGAWLNRNPNKIVVSPSHKRGNWFGMEAGIKTDCVDLIPDGWIQIEFR